jgi:glutamine synthetase
LGANEAPPAIISVFLGQRLNQILDDIKEAKTTKVTDNYLIDLGISKLPSIMRDNTDRNRTSPFAFTGSKFEFRAIGSAASVSLANTVLNAAVADALDVLGNEIEAEKAKTKDLNSAVLTILRKHIVETEAIRFEGNNYSAEWEAEAAKRGLPNVKRSAYALDALVDLKNVEVLIRYGVFNKNELEGRYNTKLEQYVTNLEIEAETFCDLVRTRVIPAAISYQSDLATSLKGLKDLGDTIDSSVISSQADILNKVNNGIKALINGLEEIESVLEEGSKIEDESKKAKLFADKLFDMLNNNRAPADELETIIPDSLWPLPKYSEMLFIM